MAVAHHLKGYQQEQTTQQRPIEEVGETPFKPGSGVHRAAMKVGVAYDATFIFHSEKKYSHPMLIEQ